MKGPLTSIQKSQSNRYPSGILSAITFSVNNVGERQLRCNAFAL